MGNLGTATKTLTLGLTIALVSNALTVTPANAVNWDTCNVVWFQYAGGGLESSGSAPGLLQDSSVFGSDSTSAECQGIANKYDSTMLENIAHTGSRFTFVISGNYVGDRTTCSVTAKLNGEEWIQGTTHLEQGSPDSQYFAIPELSAVQQNLFRDLTVVGDNEFTVTTDCLGYEQANITLEANLKIVQDSFNDFEGVSVNNSAEYTNSRSVNVNLSFERGVIGQVMISNDGGFPVSQRKLFTYGKNTVPWTLNASRDERMVKTIYVKYKFIDRYTGELESTWSRTLTDDIILDTTVPVIKTAEAVETYVSAASSLPLRSDGNSDSVRVTLSASDNKSGLSKVQYSANKSTVGAITSKYSKTFNSSLKPRVSKLYVRVSDKAGNWSPWRTLLVTKTFPNCTALNKVYPGGVSKSSKAKNQGGKTKHKPTVSSVIYAANAGKDRDRDNIACEK